jgi:hypothetical protein
VRGQRPVGVQGQTLAIEIEVEKRGAQDTALRDRETGRHYLLADVTLATGILCEESVYAFVSLRLHRTRFAHGLLAAQRVARKREAGWWGR